MSVIKGSESSIGMVIAADLEIGCEQSSLAMSATCSLGFNEARDARGQNRQIVFSF